MIRLQHVSKVFGVGSGRVSALGDVSFTIEKGEFVALNGASGAGKTTLLRLLYRDELPSEGEIEVAGVDVTALRRSGVAGLRRSIGIVFQDAKLLGGRTVFENVAFVLRVLGTPRREIMPRAFVSLNAVGLSSRAQAYPGQLSQGEAQRASLARALVKAPALLLADEPTGNLDDDMGDRDPRPHEGRLDPGHHRAAGHAPGAGGGSAENAHPDTGGRSAPEGRSLVAV